MVTAARERARAWLGVGTNVGEREANLRAALAGIAELGEIAAVSSVYETEPVGYRDQSDFWNLVLALDTELTPAELAQGAQLVESRVGRVPTFPNGPRLIDVDILYYGDTVHETDALRIPHPRLHERAFVLEPLAELAPDLRDPRDGRTIRAILAAAGPLERVRALFAGTRLLPKREDGAC